MRRFAARSTLALCPTVGYISDMTNEMPELTGSDKQIAWATTIRAGVAEWAEAVIEELPRRIERIAARGVDTADEVESLELLKELWSAMPTDAAWWINYRSMLSSDPANVVSMRAGRERMGRASTLSQGWIVPRGMSRGNV